MCLRRHLIAASSLCLWCFFALMVHVGPSGSRAGRLGAAVANAAEPSSFADRASFAKYKRTYDQVAPEKLVLETESGGQDELKLEVWASSPLMFSPVAMDVDSKGRVWCTEGIDYHVAPRVRAGQSIVVLTDTDGDGKADKSHVFVTEKGARPAPLGIAVFDNKIVLSATPDLIVYTDVNRNAVFEPGIDKREVLLTGFQNKNHDHTLHAVVGSPSGQWYFSYGNCGADLKTVDGKHYISGSYYGYADAIGKRSSDGHVYVGGMAMRMNADGTGLTSVGQNVRNTHDMFVTSMGDVFHSDNDDPAHCRVTWLMEYGNAGYADLRDGSKSWEEVGKSWEEPRATSLRGKRYSLSHWRQNYPGALPSGDVYGAGAPTGNVFIEGDELGKSHRGRYLITDMVRKELMGYRPVLRDAQIEMVRQGAFVKLKDDAKGEPFLPTDAVLGTDGALFLSDFYNSTSRRTVQVAGTIYRISRRDEKRPVAVTIDFKSTAGLLAALKNPAVNVRVAALSKLKARGSSIAPDVIAFFKSQTNPYHKARAVWLLAQLGDKGETFVQSLLANDDVQLRIVAYRALRFAVPSKLLKFSKQLAVDRSASVRREVALAMRDQPYEKKKGIVKAIIERFDGKNRWYLEAIGTAATGANEQVYDEIVKPLIQKVAFNEWDDMAKNLAWRLHTRRSIDDLDQVLRNQPMKIDEFRRLITAFTMYKDDADRSYRQSKVEALAKLKSLSGEAEQITITEVLDRDLRGLKGELLRSSYTFPTFDLPVTKLSPIKEIAKLKGSAKRGEMKMQLCAACHKIDKIGKTFGPNLTAWGRTRTIEQIVGEIVDPAARLAHGYDKPVRLVAGKHVAEGLLSNYSHHAGSLKLRIFGGEMKKILFRRSGAKVTHLKNHSWMPPASKLGLSDQDVRDIAEYLKRL
jgi:putative membrane-bound dehydrogenase-like protein